VSYLSEKELTVRWRKSGKIFDPADHSILGGRYEFAQAPKTLVCDGYVRVYFSTRSLEQRTGKYLSHVAFADFAPDFSRILDVARQTVIPLGELGAFDEHGIFPFYPLRQPDVIFGYTCGWSRRTSVSVETAIGLSMSQDGGQTFQKIGVGPILTSSLHQPFLVGDPFVQVFKGAFHMWYVFGTEWKRFPESKVPERIYKIGHAVSKDGITWSRDEAHRTVCDQINADECQAVPTVIYLDGRYHMYFCYRYANGFREDKTRGYRLGYAVSHDLSTWQRLDGEGGLGVSEDGWDSEMMCYPHIFESGGAVRLLYNGNAFGRHGFGIATLDAF